jgi:RNA polymerase sigma-32 factor
MADGMMMTMQKTALNGLDTYLDEYAQGHVDGAETASTVLVEAAQELQKDKSANTVDLSQLTFDLSQSKALQALDRVGTLPTVDDEGGLSGYIRAIKRFPILSIDEEQCLAMHFKETGDIRSAQALVGTHLRLVAKLAMGYRNYGLPVSDLISEGNIGLLRAVKKFEPERGYRLSTYAMWWIKAAINEYILSSWSMVKMGTVSAQKKLFFNLRKMKAKLGIYDGDLSADQVTQIAEKLQVKEKEVEDMDRRLVQPDSSLNQYVGEDGGIERQDLLVDQRPGQEEVLAAQQEQAQGEKWIAEALKALNARERDIIMERKLRDDPMTLEELGHRYGISRERVRQIEGRAMEKVTRIVKACAEAARGVLKDSSKATQGT